jgi:hypothetical protein
VSAERVAGRTRPSASTPQNTARSHTPQRNPNFDHLSLHDLRAYRQALVEEEDRVSYWRRIIQARLDLVRAGEAGEINTAAVRHVLAEARLDAGRRALIRILPNDDMPPLPNLDRLWERQPRPGDTRYNEMLARELAGAEIQLSAYRAALHRRIEAATKELIARYREDPSLCLLALPVEPAQMRERRRPV